MILTIVIIINTMYQYQLAAALTKETNKPLNHSCQLNIYAELTVVSTALEATFTLML